jgi:transaldolase
VSGKPLRRLAALGQSIWYDFIRRDLVQGPELARLIEEGLRGMTSNPTIFEKAIAGSALYDDDIKRAAAAGKSAAAIFEELAVRDVSAAADQFRAVFDAEGGASGFVSIEVAPDLANDTEGTIAEARRLWAACDRPNVMVKIPGNAPGVPAIRACLAEGININITLLFSIARYREVMDAFLTAAEERVAAGKPVDRMRSVASFFVSRVDTATDRKLDALGSEAARALRGKVAIANARLAYQAFEEVFAGARFKALAARGLHIQEPLWASTSTKDPTYPELYYVDALIAPYTVDTMPPETFAAYRDRGDPQVRIRDDLAGARAVFAELERLGLTFAEITRELEEEGVKKFSASYDALLATVAKKARGMSAGPAADRF